MYDIRIHIVFSLRTQPPWVIFLQVCYIYSIVGFTKTMSSKNYQHHYTFFQLFSQVKLTFSRTAKMSWEDIQLAYISWLSCAQNNSNYPVGRPPKKIILQILHTRFKIYMTNSQIENLDETQLPFEVI